MYYVTETHSFIWYLMDSPKLSKRARAIFDKKVNLSFEEIFLKIFQATNFIFSEINWSLILEVNKTKGLKDLHDRIIVVKIFDVF